MRFPSIFVNHGGGPMPILGSQPDITRHLREAREKYLPKELPNAIVVISAHYESNPISITSSAKPPMLYDYYGFPPEAYEIEYPAPGAPDLAKRIQALLTDKGISSELDEKRGFDHGVFIPLKLMYPEANIPVVTVSLHSSLDPDMHIRLGKALSTLSDDGILLLGSGLSFHNMRAFFNQTPQTLQASVNFDQWLQSTLLSNDVAALEKSLQQWDKVAPDARLCHPREEHLLPLFVIASAASSSTTPFQPQLYYESEERVNKHKISAFRFA